MRLRNSTSLLDLAQDRWRWISGCMAGCIIAAGLATAVLPKKYSANMEFLVKDARRDLTLTPAENGIEPPEAGLTEAEVNSELQLLMSNDLLQQVVRDKGLYKAYLRKGEGTPGRRALALAAGKLAKSLSVSAIRKTNVITASYRAHSPEDAADVLADLGQRYLQAHLSAHSTPGSLPFFSSEAQGYRTALQQAENDRSAFERRSQIYSSDQQRTALVVQLEDVRGRLQTTQQETMETQARLRALLGRLAGTAPRIPTEERVSSNPLTIDHLQSELADMENRRIAMLMKFRTGDRAVAELESEIANTRANLAAARQQRSAETSTGVNPLHQALTGEVNQVNVTLEALEARTDALRQLEADDLHKLSSFSQQAVMLNDLQQTENLARQSYMLYSQRMQEARVSIQMDKSNFANVSMIESPEASPVPVWPVLPLNLGLGALLGMMLGVGSAYLRPPTARPASSGRPVPPYFADGDTFASQPAGD